MHQDIVHEFPADAIPLGTNEICTVQAMYVPGKYIAVQGHPEFNEEIMSEILFNRHKSGIFSDEAYAEGISRTPIPHDGVAIGKTFLRFALEKW
jgi:GMP synthase-like glutamine amidotransferase